MVTRVATVAFEGIEARAVDVQVQISGGAVGIVVVGLADKAVGESRERVRSALIASGLALPAKRITVNLAPADLPKEGSHYDLPIALALMAAMGVLPADSLSEWLAVGGRAEAVELDARDREICAAIGPELKRRGLLFVGIDVIGGMLTEVNVTSPTGAQQLKRFGGADAAAALWDRIEAIRRAG